MNNITRLQKYTYAFILLLIAYLILTTFKFFLIPLALSFLLSYLLFPIVALFEIKLRFPRVLAIILTLLLATFVLIVLVSFFINQFKLLTQDLPQIKIQLQQKIIFLQKFIEDKTHFTIDEQTKAINNYIENLYDPQNKFIAKFFKSLTNTVTIMLFIPVFSAFMLYYRERWKIFILKIAKDYNRETTEILLSQISKITLKYVTGVLTVVCILAVSHSTFLVLIGAKYPILVGLMAASISLIPYFGTLASTVIPLSFSIVLSPNPYEPIYIIIYWLIINSIENNILTPTITGGNVNLNPLITILSLILGATLWGIAGMIVVIPFIGIIKIICDKIPGLEPYGYFLGIDKRKINFSQLRKKVAEKRKMRDLDKTTD